MTHDPRPTTYEYEKSPHMRSTTRRTTLRTAAVSAGAAAVLALPVGSAFADSSAGPEQEVLPGVEQPVQERPVQERPVEEGKSGEGASGEGKPKPVTEPAVDPTVPQVDPTAPSVERAFVTTVKLADGSIAKVYKIGNGHFEAEVFSGSTKLDTLVSKGGKPAYGQNNGLHVVLQPNGTVTSWVEGEQKPMPKPKPMPEPVEKPVEKPKHEVKKETSVRITMPDGRIAKLIDGPNGKRVEISMPNGNLLGTIDLKHPSAQNDGWTYRIVQDGKRVKFVVIDGKGGGSSWVYGFDGKLIEKYVAEPSKAAAKPAGDRVVPKGGVKAGAEGVGAGAGAGVGASTGDTPMLVAASGGMAAVGAAGLGFALLKRGRADQS
ncbi:hypothetical protein [Streptomyces sp. NRRL S-244]|uniref:hypothetical protein n=1 Tax=Streptomyces sp. NRRL S-244 TaxID=1463897 RepID=UPI0004BF8A6E|nr:hypothetical protein [Streptomyces sp. NRRL S-244]